MTNPREIVETLRIPAAHPALPGHFPGQPIVPGVVLLDCIAAAIERGDDEARLAHIAAVKFLAPLRPDEDAELRIVRDGTRVRFRIDRADSPILRGEGETGMTEHWSARPEGGGRFAIWVIRTIALRCGRPCARAFLYPATLYFFLRRGYERRVSYAFLERALGRKATAWEVMRHIHSFASTMLDRVFLLSDRYTRFDVRVHGLAELTSRMQPQRGVLLLGAHVGSFEVLRVLATERPDVKVCAVLDTQKTPALTALLHELNPAVARNVIDASRPGTEIVLALSEAAHEGALVTLLADRARQHESTVIVDFMGSPAAFPAAPFLIGALLKVPMVICIGMYRGGNRYDLYFEPFADELVLPRHARKTELRAVAQRYAARLEHHVRQDPYNWFNWHDFWNLEGLDDARPVAGERDLAESVSRGV